MAERSVSGAPGGAGVEGSAAPPLRLVCASVRSPCHGHSLSADPPGSSSEGACAGGCAWDRQGDANELNAGSSSCGPCARSPTLTPRMRAVYERTSVRPHPSVCNVNDAVVMPPNILGRKTEAIRRIALRESVAHDRASRLACPPPAPAMARPTRPSPVGLMTRTGGAIAGPPMDADLREAVEATGDPHLITAFRSMGFTSLLHLLTAQASFMAEVTIADDDLDALCLDIRRERTASTPALELCGGYPGFPRDANAFRLLRLVVYIARLKLSALQSAGTASATTPAAPPPVDDAQKPLPPHEIEDLWDAGKRVTMGYANVLPKYRLSDGIVSRMVRNNKAGKLWLPAIDRSFLYKEASSNVVITALLKCSGDVSPAGTAAAPLSDVSIQMVQGGQLAERFDPVRLVADYIALLSHRSVAIIACYCTPKAIAAYKASSAYWHLQQHSQCVAGSEMILSPAFVGTLERKLREATRLGMSTADVLAMDQRVIAAIHERMNNVAVDGNLAVEYVCDQRESLFRSDGGSAVSLDQLDSSFQSSGRSNYAASSVAPSDSVSRAHSAKSQQEVERLKKLASKFQSERDHARQDLKKQRRGGSPPSSRGNGGGRDQQTVYGGQSGHSGGGDSRGSQICRHYNMTSGCFRSSCSFRHVCDKPTGRDRVCGDARHNACTH